MRLIASPENLGFGAGCNRAAEEAGGEHVFLLNPDTVRPRGDGRRPASSSRGAIPSTASTAGARSGPTGVLDPGSCWAAPSLWSLFCFATLLTTAFQGSRFFDPEVAGRLEARHRPRGRHRHGLPPARHRGRAGRSSEASTPLLHVRGGRRPLAPREGAGPPPDRHPRRRRHPRDRRLVEGPRRQAHPALRGGRRRSCASTGTACACALGSRSWPPAPASARSSGSPVGAGAARARTGGGSGGSAAAGWPATPRPPRTGHAPRRHP